MASVPPVYGDPDLNQRRKLPSMTNTGETGIGLHDPVNESLTGEPTNTGPMAPAPDTTQSGTSRPPPAPPAPAAPATPPTPDPFAAMGGGTYFASTGQWVPNNNAPAIAAAQAAAGGVPGTSTAPPATTGGAQAGTGTEPPPAPPPTVKSAYQSALLKMLDQASTPASLEDPALKAQSDAAAVGLTRGTEAGRAALAERMAQAGGPGVNSGAFNTELAGLFNQQGEQQAGINAGLVGSELQARRNQLLQAATLAGNQLTDEEHQALQRELANLDAQIRREGIAQQGALGQGDLALRGELGRGQLNLGLLGQLMQGEQFGKRLGADLGMFNASQNSNYLSSLLSQLGV